jgi:HAD superfamily hydrolase (TIGR01509 family)
VSIAAVIFDLDGVLIDSEGVWDSVREEVARAHGGRWPPGAQRTMMGMSSTEWSRYMHEQLGVQLQPQEISRLVVAELKRRYREHLPLLAGAREAVLALAARWPLGLASSANREIIELFLERSRLQGAFAASVSSEEVARGKPAPDVYLETARRIGAAAESCAAIEDSSNGLRSAAAAGMLVIAVPNRQFPPAQDALALAAEVLRSLRELTVERLLAGERVRGRGRRTEQASSSPRR